MRGRLELPQHKRLAPDGKQTPEEQKPPSSSPPDPQLEMARQRIEELTQAYVALERDRDALRARLEHERDPASYELAIALLDTLEDLDAAVAGGSPMLESVGRVQRALAERTHRCGLERVRLVGTLFHPNLAEAVELVPTTDPEQHDTVVAERVPAYRLKGRLLRPGRVRVARFTAPRAT